MKRIIFVFVSVVLLFCLSLGRIISIINDETYLASNNNSKKTISFNNIRGTIFDCNGVRLTNCEYEYFAVVPPSAKAINEVKNYIDDSDRKTLSTGFPIKIKVDEKFFSKNIAKLKIPKRYSQIASHIIGYCDENGDGICGIEQSFNTYLKRDDIRLSFDTDAMGNVISSNSKSITESNEGNGLMLTIDKSLQTICETVAKEEGLEKGAIIILENATSKIRALVSIPSYDQNNISSSLDSDASPFYNRALAAYNCGSIFKLLVSACALYHNINLVHYCKGTTTIGDTDFNCMSAHKFTTMKKALEVSCNCYFIKLGQKIGAKRLLSFAKSFGFGSEISLCNSLKSTGAILPDEKDLTQFPAELANFSFGQGVVMTSPLHIATMISCIANGGKYYKSTLIEGKTNENGRLITNSKATLPTYLLTQKDAEKLQKYMINSVENGTGKRAKPKSAGAGGKTATAQTGIYDKSGNAVYQTWFGGFYPAKTPVYTIVVLVENGVSGGDTAAPIFKKITDKIYGI